MLNLTPQLTQGLLDVLNSNVNLAQTQELLTGKYAVIHFSYENKPYDTTASEFHQGVSDWVDVCLEQVRQKHMGDGDFPGHHLLGSWFRCDDVFGVTSATQAQHLWVRNHVNLAPLLAFRLSQTLFYFSHRGYQWKSRAWRGDDEPLMALPYQRKYDTERNGRADDRGRRHHLMLAVARDVLQVVWERVEDTKAQNGFTLPELSDIQRELERLGMRLGIGIFSVMGGGLGLELVELEQAPKSWRDKPRRATLEDGRYRGVLGGYHRRATGALRSPPSAPSQKWMVQQALQELMGKLDKLLLGRDG